MIQVHQLLHLELQLIYEQLHLNILIIHHQVFKISIELIQHQQDQIHIISMIIQDPICKNINPIELMRITRMRIVQQKE